VAHIPRRLAYDDDGGTIERKAHLPHRLAYDDDGGTDGRKALTYKLIVRTQKRLPGEELPSQLKSA